MEETEELYVEGVATHGGPVARLPDSPRGAGLSLVAVTGPVTHAVMPDGRAWCSGVCGR